MAVKLELYQIFYNWEAQRNELYDFAIPIYNKQLTHYFENSIIADLIPTVKSEYTGICSWRLKAKRGDAHRLLDKTLTREKIERCDADVMVLTPRGPSHKPMEMASIWHGKAWDNAIADLRKFIRVPKEVKYTIYENHFVANTYLYKTYVHDCLIPVMDYMRDRAVYFVDSGYASKKSETEVRIIQETLGRHDWPMAPFVLERLFSIYINDLNLKVVPL
jgi:hypothetical protein